MNRGMGSGETQTNDTSTSLHFTQSQPVQLPASFHHSLERSPLAVPLLEDQRIKTQPPKRSVQRQNLDPTTDSPLLHRIWNSRKFQALMEFVLPKPSLASISWR